MLCIEGGFTASDITVALKALSALSHEARLTAFLALVKAGPAGLSVGELRKQLQLPPATLTAHLNQLRQAGLANDTREGRVIRVRANYRQISGLIAYLTENCCTGSAACEPASSCNPTCEATP